MAGLLDRGLRASQDLPVGGPVEWCVSWKRMGIVHSTILRTSSNKSTWAFDSQMIRDIDIPMAEPALKMTGTAATKASGPLKNARTATVGR